MSLSIVIITGQSGSGKSTAIRALEDQGYFCVDNLPTKLVENLIELIRRDGLHNKLALGIDIRERQFLTEAPALLRRLRQGTDTVHLVYLESREEALIRRYSETRRVHPMENKAGLKEAILHERQILAPLRELADEIIDTSSCSPHELRAMVSDQIAGAVPDQNLRVSVLSFGFKHGLPLEADMVLDVRFLRNPYFTPQLQPMTGLDEPVSRFVFEVPEANEFLQRTVELMTFLLPHFRKEGKRRLTVAIGCTGGQHRSVAMACALAERMQAQGAGVELRHRDIKGTAS